MAGEAATVLDRARRLQGGYITVKVVPLDVNDIRPEIGQLFLVQLTALWRGRESREPAVSRDLSGHALANFVHPGPAVQQGDVRVGVKVDKTGRENETRSVDFFFGSTIVRQSPDGDDGSGADGDVSLVSRAACAVYNGCAPEEEIEVHTGCLCRRKWTRQSDEARPHHP